MKPFILFIASVFSLIFLNFQTPTHYKEGDIIFQSTSGETGKAIQLATHSQYNHCGVLFLENNKWVVYEAVQPVKKNKFDRIQLQRKGYSKTPGKNNTFKR